MSRKDSLNAILYLGDSTAKLPIPPIQNQLTPPFNSLPRPQKILLEGSRGVGAQAHPARRGRDLAYTV